MSNEGEDTLVAMQEAMAKMIAEQKQALLKCCPQCWGSLERFNVYKVRCSACCLDFDVLEIIKGKTDLSQKS